MLDLRFEKILDDGIATLRNQNSLYALIDPTLDDLLESEPFADLFDRMEHHRLRITALPADKQPYLIFLGDFDRQERLVNTLARRAQEEASGIHDRESYRPRSVCALFSAPNSTLERLSLCMARAAGVVDYSGEALVFHYWDPRLSSQFPRLFGPTFWAHRLRQFAIDAWWCYDAAQGEPSLMETRAERSSPLESIPRETFWNFNQEQLRRLEILSWANRIAGLVAGWGVTPLPRLEHLEQVVIRALHHGLVAEIDILRFTYGALVIHPFFERHPVVADALAYTSSFALVMQEWTPEFIEELKLGAWLESAPIEQSKNHNG